MCYPVLAVAIPSTIAGVTTALLIAGFSWKLYHSVLTKASKRDCSLKVSENGKIKMDSVRTGQRNAIEGVGSQQQGNTRAYDYAYMHQDLERVQSTHSNIPLPDIDYEEVRPEENSNATNDGKQAESSFFGIATTNPAYGKNPRVM